MTMANRTMAWILAGCAAVAAAAAVPAAAGPGAADLYPDRLYSADGALNAPADDLQPALASAPDGKNPKLAMLLSLLVPGMGEQYLGHTGRAKAFFVAEGAIWTSFAVFRIQGNHRKTLYKEYAEVFAGVPARDDEEFYRTIGNFMSSDGPFSANESIRRVARAQYPNSPQKQQEFYDEYAYTGDDTWTWESADRWNQYQDMRSSSLDAIHRSELSLGLLVANRLLSVIDAGIIAARRNRGHANETKVSWNLEADPRGAGATVVLSRAF